MSELAGLGYEDFVGGPKRREDCDTHHGPVWCVFCKEHREASDDWRCSECGNSVRFGWEPCDCSQCGHRRGRARIGKILLPIACPCLVSEAARRRWRLSAEQVAARDIRERAQRDHDQVKGEQRDEARKCWEEVKFRDCNVARDDTPFPFCKRCPKFDRKPKKEEK